MRNPCDDGLGEPGPGDMGAFVFLPITARPQERQPNYRTKAATKLFQRGTPLRDPTTWNCAGSKSYTVVTVHTPAGLGRLLVRLQRQAE